MPGPYGITDAGFTPKTQEEIETDLQAGVRGVFGAQTPVYPESIWGQIITIFASLLAAAWQAMLGVYNASWRASAAGVNLDNVGALASSTRRPASYSKVYAIATGVASTVIPAGRIVSITGTGARFTNPDAVTIDGTPSLWKAILTGPTAAPAGTLTTIETPVSGWTGISNAADQFFLGTDLEKDGDYRLRQDSDLGRLGSASDRAIRAELADLTGVTDAYVFSNDTGTTDANGVPPHSLEAVVDGGDPDEIAQTIYNNKAAGNGTHGNTTTAVTDASGASKSIKWSVPVDLEAWVDLTVRVDPKKFPDDGVAQIKAAIANYGDTLLRVGSSLVSSRLSPVVFGTVEEVAPIVTGVIDVPGDLLFIGLAPSPVSIATITATNRQKIRLDTSRVNVTVSP